MREIEFRAYSKRTKKMYNVLAIFFYQKVVKLSKTCGSGISFLEQLDDVVLMQYTGIKDKDGVEIYEGDIVKLIVDESGSDIGVIKFEMGGFVIDYKNLDTEFEWLHFEDKGCLEIIGNIYQNKDLI